MMENYHLTFRENEEINTLLAEFIGNVSSVEDTRFHSRAALLAHELPKGLREALVDFRLREPAGALLVSGIEVDAEAVGPTPAHWHQHADQVSSALREEIILFLSAQLLGEPFGYATLQNGRLMHNIVPVKGHEKKQIASGSEEILEWHTEEAFHPYRADYTALMCLRNPYGAPTTYADIRDLDIPSEDQSILREPMFYVRPSGSHSVESNSSCPCVNGGQRGPSAESFQHIEELHRSPLRASVLFGAVDRPYLRIDPDCMTPVGQDAADALRRLCDEIRRKLQDVVLSPGSIMFIDNYQAVHGRKPFTARFDGSDRWLKRINITRDIRRSRSLRLSPGERVIYY